ncbi:hypothetical protein D3C75_763000 [compost metagenome]
MPRNSSFTCSCVRQKIMQLSGFSTVSRSSSSPNLAACLTSIRACSIVAVVMPLASISMSTGSFIYFRHRFFTASGSVAENSIVTRSRGSFWIICSICSMNPMLSISSASSITRYLIRFSGSVPRSI